MQKGEKGEEKKEIFAIDLSSFCTAVANQSNQSVSRRSLLLMTVCPVI